MDPLSEIGTDHGVTAPPGHVLGGRYELGPLLGSGASAQVYRARDLHERVPVAVKLFRGVTDPRDARRREVEVGLLARLHHRGLVQFRDAGTEHGRSFVVTDLVEGPSLAERIRRGPPLRPAAVRRLGRRLADALAYVHDCDVVHRDVKPANVLLEHGLRPRLADFGIARALDSTATTANGEIIGTAAYLAPEQVRGQHVGPATDVYALGLVLLEVLTGRREYTGGQVEAAVARLHRSPTVPPDVPADLSDLLRGMTHDDPEQRPAAAAVAVALTPWWTPGRVAPRGSRRGRHRLADP